MRLNVRPKVRFASSLAAALLDGLFEQPASSLEKHSSSLSQALKMPSMTREGNH
jgi:hypothetical protein